MRCYTGEMKEIWEGLNEKQKDAVETLEGSLLILAGAGSGKTKTLTHRIANLVANHGVGTGEILAVTFTNKAAKEMRGRLAELLGARDSWGFMPFMGTFHGICVKLLRMEWEAAGLDKNFVIYDEDDRVALVRRAIKDLGLNDKQIKPKTVSGVISKEKNDFITAEAYEAMARYPREKDMAKIFKRYESERKKAGALDFDDLLLEAVCLFKENAEVRERWQRRFKHILVDEYQDTNAVQYQLVKLLVNESKNICVVGDDWQSIYSWRGADFTNILNFERDFPGAKVIKLEQNYRSTKQILDVAHRVIMCNEQRTEKELWTEKTDGEDVVVTCLSDEMQEAAWVGQEIGQAVAEGRKYSDVAVLYRTNAQSFAYERIFLQMQVPYKLVGGQRFFDRKEIKDVMAYLRLVVQPNDIVSFRRIVNVPARGLGDVSVGRFEEFYQRRGGDLVECLLAAGESEVAGRAKVKLVELGELLRDLMRQMEEGVATAMVVENLLRGVKYREFIDDGTAQGEDRVENLGVLVTEAGVYAELGDFLADAALMSSSDEVADGNRVTLMTLHAAKGLEFLVVFLVGMEEGVLPHSRAVMAGGADIEEERRLAYVGMTRAREELKMSWAQSRYTFGQRSYSMASRFLEEAVPGLDSSNHLSLSSAWFERSTRSNKYAASVSPSTSSAKIVNDDDEGCLESSEDFSDVVYDEVGFEVGDRVKSAFGVGEIVDADGLAVTVKLADGKTRKLNVEYARLERM